MAKSPKQKLRELVKKIENLFLLYIHDEWLFLVCKEFLSIMKIPQIHLEM